MLLERISHMMRHSKLQDYTKLLRMVTQSRDGTVNHMVLQKEIKEKSEN